MERSLWTDQRLDDLVDRLDRRFDRVDAQLGDLRTEMREVREETRAIRRDMFHGAIALFGVLAGMWATMLVHLVA